jgi:CheY-like chemotaxis protein
MVTGVGGGRRQVWFRAEVLIRLPDTVRSSSFQMSYLPSGLRCRGTVTQLYSTSLTASCRTRAGAGRRDVALVVMEVGLADMTGYEVCREIRIRNEELPVFFLSA